MYCKEINKKTNFKSVPPPSALSFVQQVPLTLIDFNLSNTR